jgi:hypothetical protein
MKYGYSGSTVRSSCSTLPRHGLAQHGHQVIRQCLARQGSILTRALVQNISANVPSELPRSIGVVHSDTPDESQIFYFDGIEMQQVQYSNSKWSVGNLASSLKASSISNGPMGAVGWNETEVRLYYVIDGSITEEAQEVEYSEWQLGLPMDDYNS